MVDDNVDEVLPEVDTINHFARVFSFFPWSLLITSEAVCGIMVSVVSDSSTYFLLIYRFLPIHRCFIIFIFRKVMNSMQFFPTQITKVHWFDIHGHSGLMRFSWSILHPCEYNTLSDLYQYILLLRSWEGCLRLRFFIAITILKLIDFNY